MSTSVTTLFSARRGRKNTYETDLDSVWGDIKITSPTDGAQSWQPDDPKMQSYLAQCNTPAYEDDYVSLNTRRSSGSTAVTPISNVATPGQFMDFGTTFKSPSNIPGTQPRLTIVTGRSSSQTRLQSHRRNLTPPEESTPITSITRPTPATALWTKEDYSGYISILNSAISANSINGIMSPPLSEAAETPVQTKHAVTSATRRFDTQREKLLRRSITPDEISTSVGRPQPTVNHPQDDRTLNVGESLTTRYAAPRIESSASPQFTILSPVSEAFAEASGERSNDGIMILDSPDVGDVQSATRVQPPRPKLLTSFRGPSPQVRQTTFNREPGSAHPTSAHPTSGHPLHKDSTKAGSVNPTPTSAHPVPHSRKAVHFQSGIGIIFDSMDNTLASSAVATVAKSDVTTPPLPIRSALRDHSTIEKQDPLPSTKQVTSIASNTTSPPLGVTGVMRIKMPSLGPKQITRKQSPPSASSSDEEARSRARHPQWINRNQASSYPYESLNRGQRQRSASLEPRVSSSLVVLDGPRTPESILAQPSPTDHRTSVVDSAEKKCASCGCTCQADREANASEKLAEAARYARKQANEDKAKLHKRSQSQAAASTVVVPTVLLELQKLQKMKSLFPETPITAIDPHPDNVSNQVFYESIRNDYRDLTGNAVLTDETGRLARADTISTSTKDERLQQTRARSASRPRDQSVPRRPAPEAENEELEEPGTARESLVRSYSELWM